MYLQIIAATILTIFVYEISAKASRGSADLPNQSEIIASFYSLKTKQKLQSPTVTMITDPARTNQSMAGIISVRLPFIGEPCGCQSLNCGCCAGMKVTQLNFDQKSNETIRSLKINFNLFLISFLVCMNFTYDPLEFAIGMDMTMNDASIFMQEMSAKNPPPICMPVPTGPLPLGVEMCVKLFNIYTPGNNLHMW